MIGWIIAALVGGALVFALLGFTGIAKGFAAIAKVLFLYFLSGSSYYCDYEFGRLIFSILKLNSISLRLIHKL